MARTSLTSLALAVATTAAARAAVVALFTHPAQRQTEEYITGRFG